MTLPILLLTTFLSLNGQVVEVSPTSNEATTYQTEVDTDIGDNIIDDSTLSTVSGGDASTPQTIVVEQNNEEVIALLNEQVELLAENSATTTGTLNTTILDLMDRMIDDYPSYYKYAGFRTSADDSYESTLYIAKKATVSGNVVTFSEDCIAINFHRSTSSSYSGYIYYETVEAPNASVTVSSDSIVYTNALDGYPTLGNKAQFPEEYIWIGIFALLSVVIFVRRNNNA